MQSWCSHERRCDLRMQSWCSHERSCELQMQSLCSHVRRCSLGVVWLLPAMLRLLLSRVGKAYTQWMAFGGGPSLVCWWVLAHRLKVTSKAAKKACSISSGSGAPAIRPGAQCRCAARCQSSICSWLGRACCRPS